jgi:uncharacterized protein YjbI with pentapeptide repeats
VPRAARPPLPPESPIHLEAIDLSALSAQDAYQEVELVGTELSGQRAGGITFRNAGWTGVDLSESRLEQLRLDDCTLGGCNLANLHARGANLTRVSIESSRLTGIDLRSRTAGLRRPLFSTRSSIPSASTGVT